MYVEGLGLVVLGGFEDHEGFDGVMLGEPGGAWHLEFTHHRGTRVGRAPTEDHLLVLYVPDGVEWERRSRQMEVGGFRAVGSYNPYWDRHGRTFEDLDGYRVVLVNAPNPVG